MADRETVAQLSVDGERLEEAPFARTFSTICGRIATNRSLAVTLKILLASIKEAYELDFVRLVIRDKEVPAIGSVDGRDSSFGLEGPASKLVEAAIAGRVPVSESSSDGLLVTAVPVRFGRRVHGALVAGGVGEATLPELEALAELAGLAIGCSDTVSALAKLTSKDRFAGRLKAVAEATRLVVNDSDVESAFRRVAAVVARVFKIKDFVIYATDPRTTLLQPAAVWGLPASSGECLAACEKIAAAGIGEQPEVRLMRHKQGVEGLLGEEHGAIRSAVTIPIAYQGEILGIIVAVSSLDRRFRQEDIALLETFAGQLGLAMHNVRMNARLVHAQLALERLTNEALIEATADGIFIIDDAGIIQAFNGTMEKITGYSAEKVVARKKCSEVIRCTHKGRPLCERKCPFHQLNREHGQRKVTEVGIAYRTGRKTDEVRLVDVELICSNIQDGEGKRRGLAVVRDLSDIKVLQDEMRIAREIQRGLLPAKPPALEGHDVHFICDPAMHVGGDCLDFIPLSGGRIGIAVSDIAGKSLPAALFVSMQKGLLRSYAARGESVTKPLEQLNERVLADTAPEVFITMIYGVYDPVHGVFTYVNAGHIPPIVYRDRKTHLLEDAQPPLGVSKQFKAERRVVKLDKGDILVLISDGITEARNDEGLFFGLPRLRRIIERHPKMPSIDLAEHIYGKVREFAGNRLQDDFTLIVLKCESEMAARRVASIRVENRTASIPEIRKFVLEAAAHLPFDREDLYHIEIAVAEAAANAIQHGRSLEKRSGNYIQVECDVTHDSLKIRVKDGGPGFTPNLSLWKTPPIGSPHGRGIHLMKVLMDEMTYENVPDGCSLVLVKHAKQR
ncbi:MAG: SpoIIE family protein phosphatase [Candidatus Aquicultorales bacterium]